MSLKEVSSRLPISTFDLLNNGTTAITNIVLTETK